MRAREETRELSVERERAPWARRVLRRLGPGLIAGASDDDPTALATYAQAGASLGYATLWTALFSYPLMAAVQYICARIGLVCGLGLASVIRRHYSRWLLYPVVVGLLIANTLNIGADLGAIAAGMSLLVPVPIAALIVPVTLLIVAAELWCSYQFIERTFKWLTLALLTYIGAAFFAHPDAGAALRGTFLPTVPWNSRSLLLLVSILGGNISPYLFFWQTDQEVDEQVSRGRKHLWQRRGVTDTELTDAAWDVNLGMFFSNVVIYFINLATAATLYQAGKHDIRSAADAAAALRPLAGPAATGLFALGIIGSGLLAVPVLAGSTGYVVGEAFGWPVGLDRRPRRAPQFYTVIAASMLIGMGINFLGINPIAALVGSAALNGFLAPPLLVVILLIANNRAIMGDRVNGVWTNLLGGLTALLMAAAAAALALSWGRS
jgi:NRAMP (natural resistance-associated macrophage protein)-like metal ion transporter